MLDALMSIIAPKPCVACGMKPRNAETSDGSFCSPECEDKWLKECLNKLSIDEILQLMADVATYADPLIEKEEERQEARLKSIAAVAR